MAAKPKKTTKKAPAKAIETDAEKPTDAPTDKGTAHSAEVLETLRSIKTKFGDDSIMTLDGTKKVDIEAVPTGSIGLDDALGIGGLPR